MENTVQTNDTTSVSLLRCQAHVWAIIIGATAAVLAYLQALHFPFIMDDGVYVRNNSRLFELPWTDLWRLFVEPYNGMHEFLPLREFSYWLDLSWFGNDAPAFRLHNILLYLLCLPLVFGLTLRLWRAFRPVNSDESSAIWAAAWVTILFSLHPSHVEAVVWISGRKDVLSGLFSLLALWLASGVKQQQGFSSSRAAWTLLALLAAMLSKASAVAVAPLIALLWIMFWRDLPAAHRHRLLLLWPLASALLAVCVALIFAPLVDTVIPLYFGVEAVSRSLAVLGWLTHLAFSAGNRHFIYPVFEDAYLHVMIALGAATVAAAVASGILVFRKNRNYALEGIALVVFLLLGLIHLQLIPYALPSLVSDRFLFLAAWPAMLFLVAIAWRLKRNFRVALLFSIMIAFGYQTAQRPQDWRDHQTLIEADLRAFPGDYILGIHKIYVIELQQGRYQDAEKTAKSIAIPEFRDAMLKLIAADHAVRLSPLSGNYRDALGQLWNIGRELKQRPTQAQWNSPVNNFWELREGILKMHWNWLAAAYPDEVSVRYNAGLWLLDAKEYQDAVGHLRVAAASPSLPESERGRAFYSLGLALVGSRKIDKAEMPLLDALQQVPPDLRAHCLLVAVYKQSARTEAAARAMASCPAKAAGAAQR